jgi:hypothetical protein
MDLSQLKTYSISSRKSKVDKSLLAKPLAARASFRSFLDSLPNILKAKELKEIVSAIVRARRKEKPVLLMMGAHVVKCGLSPLVVAFLEKGIFTSVSTNGAGIIHDFELAYCGQTSEDVACAIKDGSFGMARQTAEFLNGAIADGADEGLGLGVSVGRRIEAEKLRYRGLSIAAACFRLKRLMSVHVALGTDIIHQHPSCDGARTGEATLRDFRRLTEEVARLDGGGVVVNFGSAVILPEVFLKALSVARNLTGKVRDFTTVNFDMNFHYRPHQNIVTRPLDGCGRGYYILGHHEIMMPLLFQAVVEAGRI